MGNARPRCVLQRIDYVMHYVSMSEFLVMLNSRISEFISTISFSAVFRILAVAFVIVVVGSNCKSTNIYSALYSP